MGRNSASLELFDKSNISLAKFVKYQTARGWNNYSNKYKQTMAEWVTRVLNKVTTKPVTGFQISFGRTPDKSH